MNLVGSATVKTGTHKKIEFGFEFGLDSKTAEGWTQICYGTHIKFKLGFKSSVTNKIFYRGTRNFLDLNPESWFQLRVPNPHLIFGKIGFLKLKVCSQSCLPTLHRTTVDGRPLRLHQQEYQQSHHQPPPPHLLHLVQLLQP